LNGEIPTVANGGYAPYTQNTYTIPFSLNYEVDLFGRVRNNVAAANASLQSTAADLQNVQLVLTAELAADYFSLRELDAEFEVVQESVGYQRKGMDLVNNRHAAASPAGWKLHSKLRCSIRRCRSLRWCRSCARNMSTPSRCWWVSLRRTSAYP